MQVDAFEICSLVGCWMGYLEFESWFLPIFPTDFFPHGFFPAGFFWSPSDSSSCKLSLSSVACFVPQIRVLY